MDKLELALRELQKSYISLELDAKSAIKANLPIPPGTATKVAYDKNGLILKGMEITLEDLPPIPVDKITGLRDLIATKVSTKELQAALSSEEKKKRKTITPGTGTRINYDEHGHITSAAEIVVNDIPELPISKITGLTDRLTNIDSYMKSHVNTVTEEVKNSVAAGTYTKVTVNTNGRVVSGSNKLLLDDLPQELLIRINEVSSALVGLASQSSVDNIRTEVTTRVKANNPIVPGTYTKVIVDNKGLVTEGHDILKSDLPPLNIVDIIDLDKTLRGKAEQSEFVKLYNTVSGLVSRGESGAISTLRNEMTMKASQADMKQVQNNIRTLQTMMDDLVPKVPNEFIEDMFTQIQASISTLVGRVTVIEQQLKISEGE